MAKPPVARSSFSVGKQWGIFLSVLVSIGAVISLVIMLNYLGARYYLRVAWSMKTRQELSAQTRGVIKSLTNDINVVIYYNKKDPLYDYIRDMLEEYRLLNPKISVKTVDYLIDPPDAQKIKDTYKDFMGPGSDTNVVIFSSANGTNIFPGEMLGHYVLEPVQGENEREFNNRLTSFEGELYFTAAIFHLTSAKPPRAYFLEGINSSHHLDGQDLSGYQSFKSVLMVNNIDVTNIATLPGTNGAPPDCKLLIIAGPGRLTEAEIDNVRRYLDQGGRLFVLFNHLSLEYRTGLESVLADWGVAVGQNIVRDVDNHVSPDGSDVIVKSFSRNHPVTSHLHLADVALQLVLPRSIGTNSSSPGTDTPPVVELAWTGPGATINDSPVTTGKPVPLMVAVEKGSVKGITDQGPTRILVVGDSFFLDNQAIIAGRNRAFAGYAVNWLLGQMQLLQGVGPQPVQEYKLMMTPVEARNIRWIFLAAMPGAVLLFGGLVWLGRRH